MKGAYPSIQELMEVAFRPRGSSFDMRPDPWVLYHYKDYAPSVRFFSQVEADRWRSNMDCAGQLPDPQFLDVASIHFGVVHPRDDEIEDVLRRLGTFRVLLADRMVFYGSLVNAAPLVVNLRQLKKFRRLLNYGLRYTGTFWIPPHTAFRVECDWPPELDFKLKLAGLPLFVGFALHGTLYRPMV